MSEHPRAALDTLRRWWDHPAAYVREELKAEPDAWQEEVLEAFPHKNRIAMKASKGPGKTAVESWLLLNFMTTRPHPRIGATSITGDNIDTNLWPECSKWLQRSTFTKSILRWRPSRIEHVSYPSTWWAHARTWPKTADATAQADALAGLHADYAMFLIDESGGIPPALLATAEGVLSGGIETKVVQAGNCNTLDGALHEAVVKRRHLWFIVTINGDPLNPKRSSRVDLKWAQDLIDTYGRDNPWVKVNVLGEFPRQSINAILSPEDIEEAQRRQVPHEAYDWAQKRLGIDVARFGDDRSVIFPRQGLRAFNPIVMRHVRGSAVSSDIATRVARSKSRWNSDMEFIDATGGWGAGARDILTSAGVYVVELQFGAPSPDRRYANIRSHIWFESAKWTTGGGWLPRVPELVQEGAAPTYTLTPEGKFLVEPKKLVKARLGWSPDLWDAFATTFVLPEQARGVIEQLRGRTQAAGVDFDPNDLQAPRGGGGGRVDGDDFDPFG